MINPTSFDVSLLLSLNGDGGATLDFLMYYISGKLTWLPLYLFLLYAVYKKEGVKNLVRFIIVAGLMILVADQICNLFKIFVPKLRPTHNPDLQGIIHTVSNYRGGLYGTVSAHAATSFSFFILCAMMFKKLWAWIALGVWALLVSYSRIYLAVHFPYDVFFGIVLGVSVGFTAYWGYKKIRK